MATTKLHLVFFFFFFFFFFLFLTTTTSFSLPTAYEMLERFNFPIGILPQGVTSYLLRDDGTFEVYLGNMAGDCTFKVAGGGYELKYKRQITGKLETGKISNLDGVSVKILFVWVGITDVVVDGDEIRFYVGPLSAGFSLENFDESPRCGCGFDCGSGKMPLLVSQ